MLIIFLLPISVFAHSGNTNQGGCHMNYYTAEYHCHQRKTINPYQTYYCINYNLEQYGPYKSLQTCQSAMYGAGIIGGFCNVCMWINLKAHH